MDIGDLCLFYHSGRNPEIVGIAQVISKAYQDPVDETGKFLAIDIQYVKDLHPTIPLRTMKTIDALSNMKIMRQTRLSISPLTEEEYQVILNLK